MPKPMYSKRFMEFNKQPEVGQWREMALLPHDWMDGRRVYLKAVRGKRVVSAAWVEFRVETFGFIEGGEVVERHFMDWFHAYPWKRRHRFWKPSHFWDDRAVH